LTKENGPITKSKGKKLNKISKSTSSASNILPSYYSVKKENLVVIHSFN